MMDDETEVAVGLRGGGQGVFYVASNVRETLSDFGSSKGGR